MGPNTNVRVRAYRTNFIFNPALAGFSSIGGVITGSHPIDFSGTQLPFSILIFPQGPVLLTEDNSLQALAVDSVHMTRDPFSLTNTNYFGPDKQTRIKLQSPSPKQLSVNLRNALHIELRLAIVS